MNNSTIMRIAILGALAITGILVIQSYWVMRTWDLKEQDFNRSVQIALDNVAHQLDSLKEGNALPSQDLVNQQSGNYFVVNVNTEINPNLLEYYLRKEFEPLALGEDLQYAIYDCTSNKMVSGRYLNLSNDEEKTADPIDWQVTTPGLDYYFGVSFPNRESYLISEMRLTVLFTALLLIAIFFFIYSLIIILRQKRLSEMQKDFINNMTHEFKTPISTIKISADVFLNNPDIKKDDRLTRYATIIKEQNQRLNRQVEKVLQLAKIEKDHFQLNKEDVDVHEVLQTIFDSVEITIGQNGGVLKRNLQSQRTRIKADLLHFTNIVHNLLDNAIKYCKMHPEIEVTTDDVKEGMLLSISDQGVGISKEQQGKIFKKFYRVPTGNVHNVKGFGLGLFYVNNICQAHRWKLSMESELDKGTRISILIPTIA